jgi:arsenate reductase (glutaredoxin)
MRHFYYLKTCDTCLRILKSLQLPADVTLQDIKEHPITVKQLEHLKSLAGSYEALFSKRAKLYKEMDLKNTELKETDFKHYILEHYTFLKRPVLVLDQQIFIGNSAKVVEVAKQALHV